LAHKVVAVSSVFQGACMFRCGSRPAWIVTVSTCLLRCSSLGNHAFVREAKPTRRS